MAAERPNILLIVTDQQRGDCLGIGGHPVLQTPNMDYIGGSGTVFTRAYSEVPSCIPARHVLMAGQAPDETGMVGFCYRNDTCPWNPPATLAGELSNAGYETRLVGKLHLQPQRRRYGFDAMELADGVGGSNNDYADWLREKGVPPSEMPGALGVGSCSWVGRPFHLPEDRTYAFWAASRAIDFLQKRDPTSPFFLNVSIFEPHPPLIPPAFLYERYDRLQLPEPLVGDWVAPLPEQTRGLHPQGGEQRLHLDALTMHYCRAAYYALVNNVDLQIGRIIGALGRGGLENTYIVLVSDHGEMLGDHHLFGKCEPFEASARIPFLVRPPGPINDELSREFPRGLTCGAPVGLQDVMPTLLEAAGVSIPDSCTGRSALPFVRGRHPVWRDCIRGEHSGYRQYEEGFHYLVDESHKYIWRSQTGEELLFDLVNDPNECRDLSETDDLTPWRRRLAEALAPRPEGFSNGRDLTPGRPHRVFIPGKGPEIDWPRTRA